ncbi:hypothetical protein SHKM778_66240 [Streptomyces sp. KM77-8]|uniref:Uncharacterized protein n=1 Tax=Streptomyces haneummycinicus TaxID=3074435 RepID=A0AAT9HSF1_9ACTN
MTAPAAAGDESVRRERRRTPVRGGAFIDESTPRVTFLARDGARGWADLCRLVSAAHTAPGLPQLTWDDNHADGLTVLLGPDSDVGRALAAGRPDRAARLLAPGGRSTATPCGWRPSGTAVKAPAPAPCGWPPAPWASPPSRASGPY